MTHLYIEIRRFQSKFIFGLGRKMEGPKAPSELWRREAPESQGEESWEGAPSLVWGPGDYAPGIFWKFYMQIWTFWRIFGVVWPNGVTLKFWRGKIYSRPTIFIGEGRH